MGKLRAGCPPRAAIVVAFASSMLVSACVIEAGPAPPPGVAVSSPPPAPMQDPRPPQPSPQSTWVPGYWHWTGMQYTWIPGHWENAPPGSHWRAPSYSMRDGSYFYEPGGWTR
jgi:hypothetical protein